MVFIVKNLKKGKKLRLGDKVIIGPIGTMKVVGIYEVKDSGYTVCCEYGISPNKKHIFFAEEQVIKFRKRWLKVVK